MLLKISRQWIIHCLIHTVMLEADSSIIFFFIIKGKSSLQCYKVEKLCGDSFWSVRFKVCFLLETLRLISSILYSSLGKTGLDCGLLHLTVFFCLFGLVNTSDNLLFFCPSAVVGFFSPPNGTNLLSPCCVSLMKALYWQRTLGGRAGLMDVALTVIWVVLGGVWAFLMRTQWQWVTVCWGTGVLK